MTRLLLGLGIRYFSMGPSSLRAVRDELSRVRLSDAEALAEKALDCGDGHEVTALLESSGG